MNEGNYLLAWVFYILASVGAMFVVWRIFRFIPLPAIRNMLQLLFATFILVPWYIHSDSEYMAPAYVISIFEVLIKKQEVGQATYVLGGLLLLMFIGSAGVGIRNFVRGKNSESISNVSISSVSIETEAEA